MRILVATDTAPPEVNGVVATYVRLEAELQAFAAELVFLDRSSFRSLPFPPYPTVRLALATPAAIARRIEAAAPDAIHIATEGPIGLLTRRYCLKRGLPFTTSFHTRFPEYLEALVRLPPGITYAALRHFHGVSAGVMVATASLRAELAMRGFKNLVPWTRGVDTRLFHPRPVRLFGDGPVFLFVGRVSKEKNIEAFLDAELPGRKVIVGDGPFRAELERRYPQAHFTGEKLGEKLATHYASADVFVFPSRTDTFGLVMLEAMASGLPVAAFPVTGPKDVVTHGESGFLGDDLGAAARACLGIDRNAARARALQFSWTEAARLFLDNVRNGLASRERPEARSGSRPETRRSGPRPVTRFRLEKAQ